MQALKRRRVLLAISQAALAATLAGCGDNGAGSGSPDRAAGPEGDSDLELLASLSYDLFPYPELPPELYVGVGEHLRQQNNPAIAEGLARLREAVGGRSWKDVDEDMRIALLTMLEDTPFFAALRAGSLEVLYRSPEVFALVGYGGSAIEHGGYINRGFDAIDWLPEER